jgi:hypothetical protein
MRAAEAKPPLPHVRSSHRGSVTPRLALLNGSHTRRRSLCCPLCSNPACERRNRSTAKSPESPSAPPRRHRLRAAPVSVLPLGELPHGLPCLPMLPFSSLVAYRAVLRELRRAPPRPAMVGAPLVFLRPR